MMRRMSLRLVMGAMGLSLAWLVSACSGQAQTSPLAGPTVNNAPSLAAAQAPTPVPFTDPFAYCASVGTVDTPDARYAGTPIPDEVISGFKQAAGLQSSTEPLDVLRKTTIWRCMDGKVYVCNFGANLPCDSKARVDKTPSPELIDFCQANPESDFVPMSVTGHDTIYSWRCANGSPEILSQVDQADAQGYLQRIWVAITPGR